MDQQSSSFWDTIQWVITTVIGLLTFLFGIWVKIMQSELTEIRNKLDRNAADAEDFAARGDDSLWKTLEAIQSKLDRLAEKDEIIRLRTALDEDRRLAAADRANIAVMMSTKVELEKQLDKLFNRLVDQMKNQ